MKEKINFQDALSYILDCSNLGELLILNKALAHQIKIQYEEYQKVLEVVL